MSKIFNRIENKLVIILTLCMIIILSLLGFTEDFFIKKHVKSLVYKNNTQVTENLTLQIEDFMHQKREMMKALAEHPVLTSQDNSNLISLLKNKLEQNPELRMLYLGTENGEFHYAPSSIDIPADFDPRTRPWYQQAIKEKKVIWTDIYRDATTKLPIISIAVPVYNESGQVKGVLGSDISLETMTSLINNYNNSEQGYAFITDKKGTVIAHPDSEVIKRTV